MTNPMDAPVAEAPVAEPVAEPVGSDPFSLDESKLASLSPEQRASIDPIIDEWKTKAKAEMDKAGKTYEEKYKPHQEKAQALDELVKDPRFQQWWRTIQGQAIQQNPGAAGAITQAKPQDFATDQEYQDAVSGLYSGDSTKFKEIQNRMFVTLATPVIQQLKQGQDELKATLEMKDLFERHADAKELDAIGRNLTDPNDKSESLLESCLEWADRNGKTFEEGYARAKAWADSLRVGAQKQAMGMVDSKKASVTSGPSTNKPSAAVVEVEDAEELMAKNMEYLASGQTPPKFVIRGREVPTSGNRWSQRT